jgi:hypothetical protein
VPNKYFKYIVAIESMIDFHLSRQWMSKTYGHSEDLKKNQHNSNSHWAFTISWRKHHIYLQGDEELAWFKIRHGDPL